MHRQAVLELLFAFDVLLLPQEYNPQIAPVDSMFWLQLSGSAKFVLSLLKTFFINREKGEQRPAPQLMCLGLIGIVGRDSQRPIAGIQRFAQVAKLRIGRRHPQVALQATVLRKLVGPFEQLQSLFRLSALQDSVSVLRELAALSFRCSGFLPEDGERTGC
ncbi:MAG TPA: hypothetical protein VF772_16935 [Terriglobales bacterium]